MSLRTLSASAASLGSSSSGVDGCHLLCLGCCSSPWNHVSVGVASCFGEGSVPSWL